MKRNALDFLAEAEHDIRSGKYNLALFHLEQALQLALKYVLFQLSGSFKKTHDILLLLDEIIELTSNDKLRRIRVDEAAVLTVVREAYITARYFPFNADKYVVDKALNVVKAILHELGVVE